MICQHLRLSPTTLSSSKTMCNRTVRFAQEPPKADLIAFAKDGTVPVRQAFCILQSPPSTLAVEAVVDLSSGPKAAVTSWKTVRCHCSAGEEGYALHLRDHSASLADTYAAMSITESHELAAVRHRQVDGVKPLATPDDCFEAEDICKADAEVRLVDAHACACLLGARAPAAFVGSR